MDNNTAAVLIFLLTVVGMLGIVYLRGRDDE